MEKFGRAKEMISVICKARRGNTDAAWRTEEEK
jgi:hypothetical protein